VKLVRETGPIENSHRSGSTHRTGIVGLVFVFVIVITGCAGRRPVAASAPPPMAPTTTPSATAEKAKRTTDTSERPSDQPLGAYIEEGNA